MYNQAFRRHILTTPRLGETEDTSPVVVRSPTTLQSAQLQRNALLVALRNQRFVIYISVSVALLMAFIATTAVLIAQENYRYSREPLAITRDISVWGRIQSLTGRSGQKGNEALNSDQGFGKVYSSQDLMEKILSASSLSKARSAIKSVAKDNNIVISFSTYGYAEFASNLYAGLQKVGITNYCLVALDDGIYSQAKSKNICTLRDPMADYMPAGEDQTAKDSSNVIFRSKEFDDVQKAKYRWTIAALKLGFNCTFIDNDIAVLRNFFPLLSNAGDQDWRDLGYNVGFMHWYAASADKTIPMLQEVLDMMDKYPGLWDQDAFNNISSIYRQDKGLLTKPLGTLRNIHGDLWWYHSLYWGPPLAPSLYIMHATLGNEFNGRNTMPVKKYLFKEYDAWFIEEGLEKPGKPRSRFLREINTGEPKPSTIPKVNDDSTKLLVWVNGALLYPQMFPIGYERVDFAAGIGMAIALNRTLVLPYMRCAPFEGNFPMAAAKGHCFPLGLSHDLSGGCSAIPNRVLNRAQPFTTGGLYPCKVSHLSTLQWDHDKESFSAFGAPSFKELSSLQGYVRVLEASHQPDMSAIQFPDDAAQKLERLALMASSILEHSEPRLASLYNTSAMGEVSERLVTNSIQRLEGAETASSKPKTRVTWVESKEACSCGEDLQDSWDPYLFSLGFLDRFCGFRANSELDNRWFAVLQMLGLEEMHRQCTS